MGGRLLRELASPPSLLPVAVPDHYTHAVHHAEVLIDIENVWVIVVLKRLK